MEEPTKEELLREKIEIDMMLDKIAEAKEIKQETCQHEDIDSTGNSFIDSSNGSTSIYEEMECNVCGATIYEEYRFVDIVNKLPSGAMQI